MIYSMIYKLAGAAVVVLCLTLTVLVGLAVFHGPLPATF